MDSTLSFANQRILILAPHPDDESLATGGLIQRARKQGAEIRVVFVSDGENNPWPQRFLERRWRIGLRERERWAKRRRTEALAALHCLGLSGDDAQFLGLPDQGITTTLLQAQEAPIAALTKELISWQPTLLIAPSPHDLHPDHNAMAVIVDITLNRLQAHATPCLMHYIVHTRHSWLPGPRRKLCLTPEERAIKRTAILEHKTQIALSGSRFLAFAGGTEQFYLPGCFDPSQRIRYAGLEKGALCIWMAAARCPEDNGELLVILESERHGSIRWRAQVRDWAGLVRVRDAITGRASRNATTRVTGRSIHLRLPISAILPVERIYLKLTYRRAFYDETGWYDVTMPRDVPSPHFSRR